MYPIQSGPPNDTGESAVDWSLLFWCPIGDIHGPREVVLCSVHIYRAGEVVLCTVHTRRAREMTPNQQDLRSCTVQYLSYSPDRSTVVAAPACETPVVVFGKTKDPPYKNTVQSAAYWSGERWSIWTPSGEATEVVVDGDGDGSGQRYPQGVGHAAHRHGELLVLWFTLHGDVVESVGVRCAPQQTLK